MKRKSIVWKLFLMVLVLTCLASSHACAGYMSAPGSGVHVGLEGGGYHYSTGVENVPSVTRLRACLISFYQQRNKSHFDSLQCAM